MINELERLSTPVNNTIYPPDLQPAGQLELQVPPALGDQHLSPHQQLTLQGT